MVWESKAMSREDKSKVCATPLNSIDGDVETEAGSVATSMLLFLT